MGETTPLIWLFPNIDDALEMTPIWLEPFYGDELVFLEVTLPDDFPVDYAGSDYEIVSYDKIPPEWINQIDPYVYEEDS